MSLSGRVALVTGGGRGVGRGIALALAADGATVAVNYRRDAESAQEVVDQIVAAISAHTRTVSPIFWINLMSMSGGLLHIKTEQFSMLARLFSKRLIRCNGISCRSSPLASQDYWHP